MADEHVHPADLHPGSHVVVRTHEGHRRSGVVAAVDGRAMKISLQTPCRWLPGTLVTVVGERNHRAEVLTVTSDKTLWLTYGELLAERERRRHPRRTVAVPLTWTTGEQEGRGVTVDLSYSGAAAETDIPERDAAMVILELPSGQVRALAEVRAMRTAAGRSVQSLEFVAVPPDDAEVLAEFLDRG